jgi:protein-S-isoprenylcysteine O-methyltransferase Ste14
VAFIGLVLTAVGLGLAVWARLHLGENWSASVTIKEGHDLIRSGPYAYLRHPIYSGILLALLGTVVALGEWRGLIGFCVILISLIIKAKREEAWLAREFGGSWQEHRRHAGFLLPRF